MALSEQIQQLAVKHGATSYRNRADTQHPAYGFTPAQLVNLLADFTSKVRKQDDALIRQMLDALKLPSMKTQAMLIQRDEAIDAALARLGEKA